MDREDYFDDVQIRILRVTEDLRTIERELNFAAMEAPNDPELLEALSQLPEMDSLQALQTALDQMRHFLRFYMQVLTNESEDGERIRETLPQKKAEELMRNAEASFFEKFKFSGNSIFLRHLADGKNRKPN
jgi:hypothetical protein